MNRWQYWYYYKGGAERIPRVIGQLLIKGGKKSRTGMVQRNGNWVTTSMKEWLHKSRKEPGQTDSGFHSDVISVKETGYARYTKYKDAFFEELSKRHCYTFDNMLVVTDPYNKAPLTALLLFYTKEVCRVRYTVFGKTKETCFVGESSFRKEHKVAVYGLYAGRDNVVEVSLIDEQGNVIGERELLIQTEALPKELSGTVTVRKKSELSAMPFIMITGGHEITTCVMDSLGDIRYYLFKKPKAYGIFPMEEGRFLYTEKYIALPSYFVPQGVQYYDMDYLGRVNRTYFTRQGIHHHACLLPNGNYLVAACSFYGGVENALTELDRVDGSIKKQVVLDDLFDQYYQNWKDWVHINSIDYCEKDETVIISARNIHAVIKLSWRDGRLLWILSSPDFWKPTAMGDKVLRPIGEVKWFYQQHAAYLLPEQEENITRILVYDNHCTKRREAGCFDGDEQYSYVTVFAVDEEKGEVRMEKATRIPKSTIRSNALLYEEYNRLLHFSGNLLTPIGQAQGLIEELNYETGEILNSYTVKPGFFAARLFAPCSDVMEQEPFGAGGQEEPDIVGAAMELKEIAFPPDALLHAAMVKVKEQMEEEEATEDIPSFCVNEGIFYMKTMDGEIDTLYLCCEEACYRADILEGLEEKNQYIDTPYLIPISLWGIKQGMYDLYYGKQGEYFKIRNIFSFTKVKTV
ncbi:MAG: aryl-sulfate sulfotransferase [Ruminococcus flavefaciens]|nr:aryl-sulfate sulfotransferase [Ruminococcus flavefaciens]